MRDTIVENIRRLTDINNGKPPGRLLFERETGITESTWRGVYWARWGDAVAEAGFEPNKKTERLDDRLFLEKLAYACRHFGRVPTAMELRLYRRNVDPEFSNHTTLNSHFRTKTQLIFKLKGWLGGNSAFSDVIALLGEADAIKPQSAESPISNEGFVYLIQSGGFYKIGRSDQIERRIKEIRVALPEAAKLIHAIRTDDPSGIEGYWHRQFESCRANGEWFKLSSSDVAAFRRRKFQ